MKLQRRQRRQARRHSVAMRSRLLLAAALTPMLPLVPNWQSPRSPSAVASQKPGCAEASHAVAASGIYENGPLCVSPIQKARGFSLQAPVAFGTLSSEAFLRACATLQSLHSRGTKQLSA
eukprot:1930450-Prymnesium_polylepis.1